MALGVAWRGGAEGGGKWAIMGAHCTTQAMSEEQLKAFMEAVKADAGLQEQLKAAGDSDAVVAIAKEAGFVISAEELQRAQAEISEEELAGVIGASGISIPSANNQSKGIGGIPNYICIGSS